LALEDIHPGSGELEFFTGSHRDPDYLFGGSSKWLADAPDELERFLQSFHDDALRFGHRRDSFLGKEGDVLMWHADLAHGSTGITKQGISRQSHVTHFTTAHGQPPYLNHVPQEPFEEAGLLFISEFSKIG
jgi:ectoine hydroxylase-related dioxygenase (phytanoyl-CoA dioxygenase family)